MHFSIHHDMSSQLYDLQHEDTVKRNNNKITHNQTFHRSQTACCARFMPAKLQLLLWEPRGSAWLKCHHQLVSVEIYRSVTRTMRTNCSCVNTHTQYITKQDGMGIYNLCQVSIWDIVSGFFLISENTSGRILWCNESEVIERQSIGATRVRRKTHRGCVMRLLICTPNAEQ